MLISGQYKATKDGFFGYEIIILVEETEKSYIFNLINNNSRFSSPPQIDRLFAKSNKVTINKTNSQHTMRIWGDKQFTIFPFQSGTPYLFKFMGDS